MDYTDQIKCPKALPKVSGISYEVFDNIPSLRQGVGPSLGYLLRRISNAKIDFKR